MDVNEENLEVNIWVFIAKTELEDSDWKQVKYVEKRVRKILVGFFGLIIVLTKDFEPSRRKLGRGAKLLLLGKVKHWVSGIMILNMSTAATIANLISNLLV